jgi:hypothetical protein
MWKLTELWKNQRTVFPQLLGPSVHTFHIAGCCWILGHNNSSTPRAADTLVEEYVHQGDADAFVGQSIGIAVAVSLY